MRELRKKKSKNQRKHFPKSKDQKQPFLIHFASRGSLIYLPPIIHLGEKGLTLSSSSGTASEAGLRDPSGSCPSVFERFAGGGGGGGGAGRVLFPLMSGVEPPPFVAAGYIGS